MRMHDAVASDVPVILGVTGASWHPLLSGALKDRALQLAGTFTKALRPTPAAGHRDVSLASGSAGLAVCSGQLARTRSDRQARDAALTRIEEAIGCWRPSRSPARCTRGSAGSPGPPSWWTGCSVPRARTATATSTTL
jgi:hypothetical protein